MKESERIDYLVKRLAGNNAKLFAQKCGIDPKAVSNMRHGVQGIGSYAARIAAGYPEVAMDWLLTGEGRAIKTDGEKTELIRRMEALERAVLKLSAEVSGLRVEVKELGGSGAKNG